MTRKHAITKAIAALHQTGENDEAIRLLQDLSDELKAKYTKAFIKDYNRIKPRSQYEFSEKKRPDTRSWQTVATYYNTRSWRKLLSTLNLPLYNALHRERIPQKITVAIHHDYDFRE